MSRSCCLLVILCVISYVTCQETMRRAFEQSEIIPDVLSVEPVGLMIVQYPKLNIVSLGNVLTPSQVKDAPRVNWDSAPYKYYTVIMIDPDAPSPKNPTHREWLHWLVVNVPGNDVDAGDLLAEYIGAGPGKDSGLHRYVFLVYTQPYKMIFDEPILTNTSMAHRSLFSATAFAAKYNLGELIAGNYFQAEWDDYVPSLYEQIGAHPTNTDAGAQQSAMSWNMIILASAVMLLYTN